MKTILITIAIIAVVAFLSYKYTERFTLWLMARRVRKMAKKYDGQLREDLNEIAELIENEIK